MLLTLSDNAKTLRYYYRVIELQREQFATNDVKDNTLAGAYNNSGLVYLNAEEYPLAIEYMKKALDCLPANGNQQFQAIMNRNLAWLHMKTEEFDVAHHHLNVVEDLASELDFTVLVQFAHDAVQDSPEGARCTKMWRSNTVRAVAQRITTISHCWET